MERPCDDSDVRETKKMKGLSLPPLTPAHEGTGRRWLDQSVTTVIRHRPRQYPLPAVSNLPATRIQSHLAVSLRLPIEAASPCLGLITPATPLAKLRYKSPLPNLRHQTSVTNLRYQPSSSAK